MSHLNCLYPFVPATSYRPEQHLCSQAQPLMPDDMLHLAPTQAPLRHSDCRACLGKPLQDRVVLPHGSTHVSYCKLLWTCVRQKEPFESVRCYEAGLIVLRRHSEEGLPDAGPKKFCNTTRPSAAMSRRSKRGFIALRRKGIPHAAASAFHEPFTNL